MISRVKGMKDIMPEDIPFWLLVENRAVQVFQSFGFGQIRTPVLEPIELFQRGVGETTDIVQKEMYTLEDRKGRKLAMRPEGTAPVVRSLIQHGLDGVDRVHRFFYLAPMFRYERPQKGRLRQHHQLGAEIFGSESPLADVDLLMSIWTYLTSLGLKNVSVNLNSLGDAQCRASYRQALVEYLANYKDSLSDDSKRRFETNPLRVLDSKEKQDQEIVLNAPVMTTYLGDEAKNHFDMVQNLLTKNSIPFEQDAKLVRGLDYYTRTVFEFVAEGIGAKSSVCGGGRYDGLVDDLGGKRTPAVGFGMGLERVILLLEQHKITPSSLCTFRCAWMADTARDTAYDFVSKLRVLGVNIHFDYSERTLKNHLSRANKELAKGLFIFGDDEVAAGNITYKDLATGKQRTESGQTLLKTIQSWLSGMQPEAASQKLNENLSSWTNE